MSVISKINELRHVKNNIKQSIEKDFDLENIEFRDYDLFITRIVGEGGSVTPSLNNGTSFTGATVPLTYYNMTNDKERIYHYKSNYKINIVGLDERALIVGNNSEYVIVKFDTSSTTTSIKDFTIELSNGVIFQGIHAHYGNNIDITQTLLFYDMDSTLDGTLGTIETNYGFKVGNYSSAFAFSSPTSTWNSIYPHQVLNVRNIDYSNENVLAFCYKFNQPIDLTGATVLSNYFLYSATSFNQPIDLSNITYIGYSVLAQCLSFNQEIDISSIDDYTSLGRDFLGLNTAFNSAVKLSPLLKKLPDGFLTYCPAFNQPLDLSNIEHIGHEVMTECFSFNHPLDLSNLITIGDESLSWMYAYNHEINLESIYSIGNHCFVELFSLNKPFKIGTGLDSVGIGLLDNCYSLTSLVWNSNKYPSSGLEWDLSFSKYIKVYGTYRTNLMSALPNKPTKPYRRLTNGGS